MSPRPDVSLERKHQILNAAEEVFSRKGFDEARIDDIAEETGLSKGTIYWYFDSKDEIIIGILDRIFQREFKHMESLNLLELPANEAVWQYVKIASQDITNMLQLMPIAYEFLALAFRNQVVQKALQQYFGRYMDILIPIIQGGIDSGEFRPVEAREVAIAIGAIFEGTILLWVYDQNMVEPERHISSGIRLLLEGIRA